MILFPRRARITVNIYIALLLYLLIAFVLLFAGRFVFFWLNKSYFPGLTFQRWLRIIEGGLHFDLSAILYVNAPFILLMIIPFTVRYKNWYQKTARTVYLTSNGLAILISCIDFIYFRFTLRRSTSDVFKEFSHENKLGDFFIAFLSDYWWVLLIFLVFMAILVLLYNYISIKKPSRIRPLIYYPSCIVLFPVSIICVVGGIRGDFRHSTRPITMSNAGEFVVKPSEIPLVLNTPFCMIRTIRQKFYHKEIYFPENRIDSIYTPVQKLSSSDPFRFDNVVIIILESFGQEGIGYYNKSPGGKYKGYTPFLDSLLSVSRVCPHSFANGRKSIDALPSILAGIPSAENSFVLTPYAADSMKSLPAILKEKGYQTSFFHGAANGSMGFKGFVNLAGVDKYYGRDEYNNDDDFDGLWGIWDEPFFQFLANTLDTIQQPFFSTIFSVSSHHPFKVPEKYNGIFPKGTLPIHQCMGYTDMALRRFFETAGRMKWFANTLFVLTADHATISSLPEYQTAWGDMAIPIAFYHPGDSLPPVATATCQQTDIMPSILSYLHYNGTILSFGKNVFIKSPDHFLVNYNNGFNYIRDNYLLQFDGQKTTGIFDYVNDLLMKNNLKTELPQKCDSIEIKLKAFIQQYHNRLIDDRIWPE